MDDSHGHGDAARLERPATTFEMDVLGVSRHALPKRLGHRRREPLFGRLVGEERLVRRGELERGREEAASVSAEVLDMHQQPLQAPLGPKRSSSAGHRSGVSGRMVSRFTPAYPDATA
jgi:hypothetical protein